ncbi:hypothetical protein OZD69_07205 [Wolbachia endosymbiont of Drosophila chauvacae]|nr:hypothetical protein [Wolbachia endosymbiont of Drosophila chauvacae]
MSTGKLGTYRNVKVDMRPEDTPRETIDKLITALESAKAEVEENKRRAEAKATRPSRRFFGPLFG